MKSIVRNQHDLREALSCGWTVKALGDGFQMVAPWPSICRLYVSRRTIATAIHSGRLTVERGHIVSHVEVVPATEPPSLFDVRYWLSDER